MAASLTNEARQLVHDLRRAARFIKPAHTNKMDAWDISQEGHAYGLLDAANQLEHLLSHHEIVEE